MSERLRVAYEVKEEKRIRDLVELKHGEHNAQQREAGKKFMFAHPEWYPQFNREKYLRELASKQPVSELF